MAYTNAPTIVGEDFQDTEDLDGLFSGFDAEERPPTTARPGSTRAPTCAAAAGTASRRPRDAGRSEDRTSGSRSTRRSGAEQAGSGGPAVRAKPRAGRDPAAPALRLPGAQAALRPLHAGDGAGGVRRLRRSSSLQVAEALVAQQRARAHHRVLLRRRLDPPHRRACRTSARRRSCSCCWATSAVPAAGSWRCAGTPASRGRPTSPRCSTSFPATSRCRTRSRTRTSTTACAGRPGATGFWGNMDAYTVSLLKAWWGDAATADNDFCFDYLPRLTGDHGTYRHGLDQIEGKVQGYFLVGENPAVGSANGRMQRLGLANLDWLVVRDLQMIESATFWKDGPEIETGELRDRGHRHRGVLPAGGHPHREGRHVHQHPAAAAVAPQGGRAARRRPQRPVVLLPPGPADPREARRLHRRARPAAARPHLGLPERGATGEPSAEAVLREINGTGPDGKALSAYTAAEGRRLDALRLLDLLRRLRRRGQPGRPPQARAGAGLGRAGVGLGVAGQPADALQPGLGRPGRQAVERAQGLRLVGRRAAGVDRPRRPRLRGHRRPHHRPARGGAGPDAIGGRRAVHHADRRQGVAVRPGRRGRRADADALRAAGVAGAQRAVRRSRATRRGSATTVRRTRYHPEPGTPAPRCSRTCSPRTG